MKLLRLLLFLAVSFSIFCCSVEATRLNYYSYGNQAGVYSIYEFSTIEGKSLYSELLLKGFSYNNKNFLAENQFLTVYIDFLEGNRFWHLDKSKIDISICNGDGISGSGDYTHFSNDCNITMPYSDLSSSYSNTGIEFKINLSNLSTSHFDILIKYTSDNFVESNGEYYIGWISTAGFYENCNNQGSIQRTLMLPSDSAVLESWNNLEIIYKKDNRWVLEVKDPKEDAMVWYRDIDKEKIKQNFREILIIAISLSLSLIVGVVFSYPNLNNSTKSLISLVGLLIFFIAGIYLLEPAKSIITEIISPILSCLIWALLFLIMLSSVKSGEKSYSESIFEFIKSISLLGWIAFIIYLVIILSLVIFVPI